jgi:hypothetical protein
MDKPSLARLQLFELVLAIALVTGCAQNNNNPDTSSLLITPIASMTSIMETSPTSDPTAISTESVWEIMENWSPANQIRVMLIDRSGDLWTGGPGGVVHWDLKTNTPTVYALRGNPQNTNVTALSQTTDGTIWVGTFGNGLARFDGSSWRTFTTEDGLPGNNIVAQTVTSLGELWFTTKKDNSLEDAHFAHFDGTNWIIEQGTAFQHLATLPDDSLVGVYNPPPVGGIYFTSYPGIFDGQRWNDLGIYPGDWVDAITVAPDGVLWVAIGDTVHRYENSVWKELIPPWKGMDFTFVSSIAVSAENIAWFGFSRYAAFDLDPCGERSDSVEEVGVYRYDGKTWTHFTTEDGLIDNKICAISLDLSGNVWFGSYDKGVSRFNGETWTSYIVP